MQKIKEQWLNITKYIRGLSTKGKVKLALFTIFCIAFLFSVIYIFQFYFIDNRNHAIYTEIQSSVDQEDNNTDTSDVSGIDFTPLWAINPDIYAYIKIPGTDISYPIAQSDSDNSYYLEHTVEGASGYPGSIYTENYNSKTFSDKNTIIYGHNMSNGTMFAQLYNFSKEDFFKNNQYVYIFLPNKILKYRIFAAVMFDDRYLISSYNFRTDEGLSAFLSDVKAANAIAQYDDSVEIKQGDKIITLSTCMPYDMPSNRWLVEAVLEDEE